MPGPFYGAMTDNCWVGRLHAPRHVLYGDDIDYEQEFLYRQPRNLEPSSLPPRGIRGPAGPATVIRTGRRRSSAIGGATAHASANGSPSSTGAGAPPNAPVNEKQRAAWPTT